MISLLGGVAWMTARVSRHSSAIDGRKNPGFSGSKHVSLAARPPPAKTFFSFLLTTVSSSPPKCHRQILLIADRFIGPVSRKSFISCVSSGACWSQLDFPRSVNKPIILQIYCPFITTSTWQKFTNHWPLLTIFFIFLSHSPHPQPKSGALLCLAWPNITLNVVLIQRYKKDIPTLFFLLKINKRLW